MFLFVFEAYEEIDSGYANINLNPEIDNVRFFFIFALYCISIKYA